MICIYILLIRVTSFRLEKCNLTNARSGQPFSRDGASLRGGCSGGARRATAGWFDFELFGLMEMEMDLKSKLLCCGFLDVFRKVDFICHMLRLRPTRFRSGLPNLRPLKQS